MPRATTRPHRPRVLVLSAAIGAGHDGAARELARRLDRRGVDATIRDWTDLLPTWGRRVLRDLYQPSIALTPALFDRIFTDLERPGMVSATTRHLCRQAEPEVLDVARGADAVVATYPLAAQTLGAVRGDGRLDVPGLVFLTDPAAHRTWCHTGLDEHLTVTEATARDAARYDVAARAVGALCAPRFSRPVPRQARARVRAELGLPSEAPVALVVSGSLGMGEIDEAVAALSAHPRAWALVACGRNEKLRKRLARAERVVALGWRDDVPELMAASDLLVHNAGGLSCTEALVAGLPTVTYRPIPGHGRANAAVLAAAGLAPWPTDPTALAVSVDDAVGLGAQRRRRTPAPWWLEDLDASAVVARYAGAPVGDEVLQAAG